MKTKIAIVGAGGKMGRRITTNLKGMENGELLCIEINKNGRNSLEEAGFTVVEQEYAERDADVFVLAIPDNMMGKVTRELVPKVKSGALIIGLDPAAAYAGALAERSDITYFICHPCHPMLFNERKQEELDQPDWFGGLRSPQSIVCAIHSGDDELYQLGESIARAMFQPILNSHRITVEQMAILEPAVVETTTASLLLACRQAMDKAIEMGVPKAAAWDFVMGHMRVELAVVFGFADFPFSDGALKAIKEAQGRIFKDNWLDSVFDLNEIRKSVKSITETGHNP